MLTFIAMSEMLQKLQVGEQLILGSDGTSSKSSVTLPTISELAFCFICHIEME
jgi:hypothetical protein